METRTITQVKIYKLVLNPMRGRTEANELVAAAYEKQALFDLMQRDYEPWQDVGQHAASGNSPLGQYSNPEHKWQKPFKKGSSLEWYNKPNPFEDGFGDGIPNNYGVGIHEQWVEEDNLNHFLNNNPQILMIR